MKNDFYETELKKVQKCCNKYGYHAFLRFDELHIRSKFESWYFIPNEFGGMKVIHWNGFKHPDDYHKQFYRKDMTYEELIQYIHEHEEAKYKGVCIHFTFSKFGNRKTALCS